jgi:hypothetical protein
LAVGGTLLGAAPASALGTASKSCSSSVTFTGQSSYGWAETFQSSVSGCGSVGAQSAYRFGSGVLQYSGITYGSSSALVTVPSGAVGEGGRHSVTNPASGYASKITT